MKKVNDKLEMKSFRAHTSTPILGKWNTSQEI